MDDHKGDAMACLIGADNHVGAEMPEQVGEYKADVIATAQVHATLYLAEQQRIANLIALAALPDSPEFEDERREARDQAMFEGLYTFDRRPATSGIGPAGLDDYLVMRPDIARALGLETDDA